MSPDQEKIGQSDDVQTAPVHAHRVLVVDDELPVGKSLGRILDREGFAHTYAASGEEGMEALEAADQPFSLILSDQRMPGMSGTDFLARAKELSPDTIRYLITGYSEMETIISAVNRGAVQRFISKPWDNKELRQAILEGIALYTQHLDSERLFALAKKQNTKLYDLNCQLMEQTKALETQRNKLEGELDALKEKLAEGQDGTRTPAAKVINALCDWLRQEENPGRYMELKRHTLAILYDRFTDLALRNGMEMPGVRLGAAQKGGTGD